MANIILFGTGAMAQVLHYYLSQENHQVVAFTVDQPFIQKKSILGCPVVAFEEVETLYPPTTHQMMVAIGYVNMNQLRAERCTLALEKGYQLFSYVHPSSLVWNDLDIKPNTYIGEKCVIQPFTQLGENVFIGGQSSIGHHTVIKDHCFIASCVSLAGSVVIEPYSFLGTGSLVRNKVSIAERSLVGAGAIILNDTRKGGVYAAKEAKDLGISSDFLSPG